MAGKLAFAGLQLAENIGKLGYVPVFSLINGENA
jgi:hypothetical protein